MGTHTKGLQLYWFSVLKYLSLFYLIPVKCASYCFYYYSSYYLGYRRSCYYYYYYYYYDYSSSSSSSLSTLAIIAIAVGSVVGFIIFVSFVIGVCTQACKKNNQGRMIVQPLQPNTSLITTTQSSQGVQSPLYYHPQYPPPAYPSPVFPPPAQPLPNQIPEQAALPS